MNTRDLHPPGAVGWIARRLAEAGFETWAVGGAVRDAVHGNSPEDWDLATSARPRDVQRIFRRTVPVGVDHGTVGVLARDGHLYEVTTFRRDVETFGRRARVAFADNLEEDLERRDFTINALAWNPLTHELKDPHGGAADLQRRVLRTVGNPAERFAEDRLRVLRALRFAGRYGMDFDADTWRELQASAGLLDDLSAERVREELYKVLNGPEAPSRALQLYERSGVLAALYPELQACVGFADPSGAREDLWSFQIAVVDALARGRTVLRLAALLHGIGRPVTGSDAEVTDDDGVPAHASAAASLAWGVMRRLKASNADADRVGHLVAQHASVPDARSDDARLRRWLSRVGIDHHRDLLRLVLAMAEVRDADEPRNARRLARRVRAVLAARPPLVISDLAIGGSELRAAGIPPGPRYGEILRDLLDRVIDDPEMNTRDGLMKEVGDRR